MKYNGTDRGRLTAATAAVLGIAGVDLLCALNNQSATSASSKSQPIHVKESVAINRSPDELYEFWRDFTNFPRVMTFLESVEHIDEQRSRWLARVPDGKVIEWISEVIHDVPDRWIEWRSLPDSDLHTTGSVSFKELLGRHGTAVTVEMEFTQQGETGGKVGALVKRALRGVASGLSESNMRQDLLRFKQIVETGQVASAKDQPAGGPQGDTWLDTVARM
jgi:uncharacterized membrane protein